MLTLNRNWKTFIGRSQIQILWEIHPILYNS